MAADDKKIIFSMVGVSKAFTPNKNVLKDIYLSFFYGAKIGIIGLNGSGINVIEDHRRFGEILSGRSRVFSGIFRGVFGTGTLFRQHKDSKRSSDGRCATHC